MSEQLSKQNANRASGSMQVHCKEPLRNNKQKKFIDLPCLDPLGVLRLLVLRKNLIWGFGGRDKGLCWALACRFGLFICLNVDPDDTTSLEAPDHPEPRPVASAFSSIKGSFELVFKYWKKIEKKIDFIKNSFSYWKKSIKKRQPKLKLLVLAQDGQELLVKWCHQDQHWDWWTLRHIIVTLFLKTPIH